MADFEKAIPLILKHEGGYVFHPNDPGGETNLGITDMLDGKVDGMVDLDGDKIGDVTVKGLTVAQAKQVYKSRFWDKMQGDKFKDQQIANIVFDGYVNMGARALKMLQKELGCGIDGRIGPNTLAAINSAAPHLLFDDYKDARRMFYIKLAERKPKLKDFLKGWLNRIDSFKYEVVV